jgi:hypothetical protein
MNEHPTLNTDATQFPPWGAVRINSPVHDQLHCARLAKLSGQWVMPISQQLVRRQTAHPCKTKSEVLAGLTILPLPRSGNR